MSKGHLTKLYPHRLLASIFSVSLGLRDSNRRRRPTTRRRDGQRGGALVEAAMVSTFLYAPLLIGLVVVGISTINRIQLDQLVRDVGIMHARGMDFSSPSGYDLFIKLTEGSPFREAGDPPTYNGTMIVSTIRLVSETDCADCSNLNQAVISHRVVLGNPTLHASKFGTPATVDGQGRVPDWRNDASARAPAILNFVNGMQPGDEAFVAEGYLRTPTISFPEVNAQAQTSSWAIF